MTTLDSGTKETGAPRKRGAPKGNRNAWKHGARSAAAKAERAAIRERRLARLPDARVLQPSLAFANFAHAQIAAEARRAENSPDKTNNSVPLVPEGEGGHEFSPNKTNNSVLAGSSPAQRGRGTTQREARESAFARSVVEGAEPAQHFAPLPAFGGTPPASQGESHNSVARSEERKRGAPKGNKNALKHGMKSAERRAFNSDLLQFIHRLNATCGLAHAIAQARGGGAP